MTVVHNYFFGSIIVEICTSYTVTIKVRADAGASIVGEVEEPSVALVPAEELRFAKCIVETFAVELGIDMAVRHEDVGPAVVVDVEEERAPS